MPEQRKLDLPASDRQIVESILCARIPDRPVYVFGSRAQGRAGRFSDLDLAVGGVRCLTLRDRALLADDFTESDLPIFVDVVDLNEITPEFKQRIERDFIMIQPGTAREEAA